jgi:rhodanese-related sulfurtransferase
MTGIKNISVADLERLMKLNQIQIIDIRPSEEYQLGHLPNTKNIPLGNLSDHPEEYLQKDEKYYIICDQGKKSVGLCYELGNKGYYVINVLGGTEAYKGELTKD